MLVLGRAAARESEPGDGTVGKGIDRDEIFTNERVFGVFAIGRHNIHFFPGVQSSTPRPRTCPPTHILERNYFLQ